ncbi:transposase IS116/IS110/IS902 family protein [Streptomyces jeddahensis]|uniref:Transposase IS116/IS110/IS902 family protein n=1 Tax=Streptomyces jeddahensis TaxID=1716141 RepID=A0A177HPD5_9ACTN|nr:transposase IS116/IS110/IS902 family protein [Streptomyces jeddahensis]
MPGIGVRTAARILIDVGDGTAFPTAGHLAAYAGLAPVTRASGSSIRGEHPARRSNRQLKRALYVAAFTSLKQPESRAYYDKKRKEGKHHVAAVIALARRRVDVLFAMLRDGTFYQAPAVTSADEDHRGTLSGPACSPSRSRSATSPGLRASRARRG